MNENTFKLLGTTTRATTTTAAANIEQNRKTDVIYHLYFAML